MPTILRAPISIRTWWLWNQIPVTVGNLVGAVAFVALPMLWIRSGSKAQSPEVVPIHAASVPVEAHTGTANG